MANTVISPNMNMPVPVVGVDPGPDWATNVDACLSIVDSHNHTPGQGVLITPQAMNINADLPMNNNNLITARSVRFQPQAGTISGPSDLGALYENGVDLWYVDGAGNQVRITQGGSVTGATGTITGLPSGTASAAFAGSTFTFQSATNTPATINAGPLVIGQPVASGFNVTLSPNVAQAANYALTLPIALPAVQSAFISDPSGNESFLPLQATSYTPVVSAGTGGSGFVASGPFMIIQTGDNIQVAGKVDFAPSSNVATWSMTLPVVRTAGNFTAVYQGIGNITRAGSTAPEAGQVTANIGTQLVDCVMNTTAGVLGGTSYIQFTYSLVNI